MTVALDWADAKRLLCVRLDSMGDVLMTTPAIRAVKESGVGRRVTLLTSSSGGAVAHLIPHIDEVILYDAPWLKATAVQDDATQDHRMIERLRDSAFDAAIIFTVFSQSALPSALLCYLADIPLRLAHARENPYQLLSTWVPDPEPTLGIRHEVERQLALVEQVGYRTSDTHLVLNIPNDARHRVHTLLDTLDIAVDDPWIVLHPGATVTSRRYPPNQFAEAVRTLQRAWTHRVLVTGSTDECALVNDVCHQIGANAVGLAGCLNLAELVALIAAAPLLLTNNTGPAHIAAAVGTDVVDLYALTNPQHTPWRVRSRVLSHDVPCKHCFKSVCPHGHNDCLRQIAPRDVARAALELLVGDSAQVSPVANINAVSFSGENSCTH